ncbi:hypothetical protein FB639_001260 [Coemansia asiatica]|nr:hypothetical protein FB639_001260 [Coemansia asiatica]
MMPIDGIQNNAMHSPPARVEQGKVPSRNLHVAQKPISRSSSTTMTCVALDPSLAHTPHRVLQKALMGY